VDQERASVLTRSVWTFVWFAIISVGTNAWWSWASWSGFAVVGPLITLVGLVGMVAVWTVPLSHQRLFEHVSFVTSLLAVALTNGSSIATSRFFYTDSAAFNQLATQLLVKGHNPYSATFKPAMLQLNHAADFWTYTLSGGHVDKVSYPAGSFVMQAPFQLTSPPRGRVARPAGVAGGGRHLVRRLALVRQVALATAPADFGVHIHVGPRRH
jgi:hypothetical protein